MKSEHNKECKMQEKILHQMDEAEDKAWEALSGYKFLIFGYHAARWVTYKKLLPFPVPSPFVSLVSIAREKIDCHYTRGKIE
jgi:hypothetical protein